MEHEHRVLEALVGVDLTASYHGKTVLVTGDTGFKGSWLASWLMHLGANVVGFALPAPRASDNFVRCALAVRITHIDGDVRDHERVAAVIRKHQPAVVFHLAAQSLVLESFASPRETFETNIMGTVNVLEAVRAEPSVRAVVIVTSDKCYAQVGGTSAFRENDAMGGHDPYSASKGAAELVTAAMRQSFFLTGAAIASARAGNVIGGGDWAANRIVPDCIRSLQAGEPIVVRNPGAVRPWQHVLDALHGYLLLGARLLTDGARHASGWNFGPADASTIPVHQLVDAMIAAWGSGSHRTETAGTHVEAHRLELDITKAREQLGWRPVLDFPRAIALTVDGYRAETTRDVLAHRFDQIRAFEALARG